MDDKTIHAIQSMLTGLGIPSKADPDVLIRTYCIAVHGIREDSVIETCGKFIRGEVQDFKPGRAPTTDIFTRECKSEASAKTARENRAHKQIAHDTQRREEISVEQRVKVGGWFELLRRSQRGDKKATEELNRLFPNAMDPWKARYPHLFVERAKA